MGGAIGTAVGALAAVIATTAVIALPGIGLVTAGPLAAAFAEAGRVPSQGVSSELSWEWGSRRSRHGFMTKVSGFMTKVSNGAAW